MNIADRLLKMSNTGAPHNRDICFLHGEEDTLISSEHSQKLYDSFTGRKMLILFEGSHNSSRPQEVILKCFEFIEDALEAKVNLRPAPRNRHLEKMV